MSKFEVIRGVEGYCLSLDDTRIAGPKPWGGGEVIHAWETDNVYTSERTCYNDNGWCSECEHFLHDHFNWCPWCGAKVVKE